MLGSNSTFNVLGDFSDINIGWNDFNAGSAIGELNALASGATVALDVASLVVGHNDGTGTAQGTLRWNQTEAIQSNATVFSQGAGAVGILDVPTGGTFRLGTQSERSGTLTLGNLNSGTGTASATLDFSATNPTMEMYLNSDVTLGYKSTSTEGTGSGTLVLGSNSTFNVLGDFSDINIGWNDFNAGSAIGELNALASGATVALDVASLVVGHNDGTGTAQGTLRWNQTEAIQSNATVFSQGAGAVGILDVPTGGTFRLGTQSERSGTLTLGNLNSGTGTASATLDFSATNPTMEMYLNSDVTLGYKSTSTEGTGSGTLVLGSNSTFNVLGDFSDINIGWNDFNAGSAVGELDATLGIFNFDGSTLSVGRNDGTGSAAGELTTGDGTTINVNTLNVAFVGQNTTSVVNLDGGTLTADVVNVGAGGVINMNGGTLIPGNSPGTMIFNGDYNQSSLSGLEIELFGASAGNEYDQIVVNGGINLNTDAGVGGTLDVELGFAPTVGDSFIILDNDHTDPIIGNFGWLG